MSQVLSFRCFSYRDIELVSEWLLAREATRLKSDVMLVPHHGSSTSSIARFIEAVSSQLAIASLSGKEIQWACQLS